MTQNALALPMSKFVEFLTKSTSQVIYFKSSLEEAVIKSIPAKGYFAKFKDGEEFETKGGSKMVADAIEQLEEITKEEYENFGVDLGQSQRLFRP